MKFRLFLFLVLATSVHATGATYPPAEYDHLYKGELTVIVAQNAQEIAEGCPKSRGGPLGLACSIPEANRCTIVRRNEERIRELGWTVEIIMRHEIAHCNGWPADHAGGY